LPTNIYKKTDNSVHQQNTSIFGRHFRLIPFRYYPGRREHQKNQPNPTPKNTPLENKIYTPNSGQNTNCPTKKQINHNTEILEKKQGHPRFNPYFCRPTALAI